MEYIKKTYKDKLIYGIGITDVQCSENYNQYNSHRIWVEMLRRCYSNEQAIKFPSYIGCSVCDAWKLYSNFKQWFDKNYIEGYQLDKDILIDGNKVYSTETCCFVPQYINCLFTDSNKARGIYKIGCNLHKLTNKYISQISINNKKVYLGLFDNEMDAHNAWLKAKREYARKLAINAYMNNEIDEIIMNAIIIKAYNLK